MKKSLFIAFALLMTNVLVAQDPLINQSNAAANYTNPAFTGTQKGYLANLSHRNQWPNIIGNYVTSQGGIQRRFEKGLWGLGLSIWQDNAGAGTLITSSVNLTGSKLITINANTLSIGFQAGYYQKALDWNKLIFGDQIDQQLGFLPDSDDADLPILPGSGIQNVSNVNIGAGAVFYGKWGNIGIAGHNITQPEEGFESGSVLPFRFTAHGTYQKEIKNLGLALTSIFKVQQDFSQFTNYITANYKWFKFMSGYTLNDAVLAGIGIAPNQRITLQYHHEITVSKLTPNTGGSHEISLRYRFGAKGDYEDNSTFAF